MALEEKKNLWKEAREATEKASKRTGFIKYKDSPESSVFFALYEQIFKLAEIAAYSELKKGKSEEEAIQSASSLMKKNVKE